MAICPEFGALPRFSGRLKALNRMYISELNRMDQEEYGEHRGKEYSLTRRRQERLQALLTEHTTARRVEAGKDRFVIQDKDEAELDVLGIDKVIAEEKNTALVELNRMDQE